jgi:hypothetical protein
MRCAGPARVLADGTNNARRSFTQDCDAEQRVADGAARHPYQCEERPIKKACNFFAVEYFSWTS